MRPNNGEHRPGSDIQDDAEEAPSSSSRPGAASHLVEPAAGMGQHRVDLAGLRGEVGVGAAGVAVVLWSPRRAGARTRRHSGPPCGGNPRRRGSGAGSARRSGGLAPCRGDRRTGRTRRGGSAARTRPRPDDRPSGRCRSRSHRGRPAPPPPGLRAQAERDGAGAGAAPSSSSIEARVRRSDSQPRLSRVAGPALDRACAAGRTGAWAGTACGRAGACAAGARAGCGAEACAAGACGAGRAASVRPCAAARGWAAGWATSTERFERATRRTARSARRSARPRRGAISLVASWVSRGSSSTPRWRSARVASSSRRISAAISLIRATDSPKRSEAALKLSIIRAEADSIASRTAPAVRLLSSPAPVRRRSKSPATAAPAAWAAWDRLSPSSLAPLRPCEASPSTTPPKRPCGPRCRGCAPRCGRAPPRPPTGGRRGSRRGAPRPPPAPRPRRRAPRPGPRLRSASAVPRRRGSRRGRPPVAGPPARPRAGPRPGPRLLGAAARLGGDPVEGRLDLLDAGAEALLDGAEVLARALDEILQARIGALDPGDDGARSLAHPLMGLVEGRDGRGRALIEGGRAGRPPTGCVRAVSPSVRSRRVSASGAPFSAMSRSRASRARRARRRARRPGRRSGGSARRCADPAPCPKPRHGPAPGRRGAWRARRGPRPSGRCRSR